jgi:hypothetical protein
MSIRSGNPDSSIRFLDADELRQAREAQRLADNPEPVCTCPTEMRIDGVDYIVRGGVYDAGCRVHNTGAYLRSNGARGLTSWPTGVFFIAWLTLPLWSVPIICLWRMQ